MRRLAILILSCFFFFISCKDKMHVPKKIIQPEQMGLILWDMIMAQNIAQHKADSDSLIKREDELRVLTSKVFETHKISAPVFEQSYNWYVQHPAILRVILDSIQVQKQREFDIENSPEGAEMRGPASKKIRRFDMEEAVQ